jgi:hypothetical protein
MITQVDENTAIEVCFDPADHEEGFGDDIRFCIYGSGPGEVRTFAAEKTSLLLTCEQAERLASALQEAATESRRIPRSVWPGVPCPDVDS